MLKRQDNGLSTKEDEKEEEDELKQWYQAQISRMREGYESQIDTLKREIASLRAELKRQDLHENVEEEEKEDQSVEEIKQKDGEREEEVVMVDEGGDETEEGDTLDNFDTDCGYAGVYMPVNTATSTTTTTTTTASDRKIDKKHEEANDRFVYDQKNIVLGKMLGEGHFAATYVAEIVDTKEQVAVKILTNSKSGTISGMEQKKELCSLLNVGDHRNLMKFIGIMARSGAQCFLTEFCELGSVDQAHQKYDLTKPVIFWKIAHGLFSGLCHLHSNRLIHRDIACRNLLLKANFEIRIADFGLTVRTPNDEYKSQGKEALPWPWMPPETLKSGIFRSESDVWAAGVTLWEIITKGQIPYAGEDGKLPSLSSVRNEIINGKIALEVPQEAPWCRHIIESCLAHNRHGRVIPSEWACLDSAAAHPVSLEAVQESGIYCPEDILYRVRWVFTTPEDDEKTPANVDDWIDTQNKAGNIIPQINGSNWVDALHGAKLLRFDEENRGKAFFGWARFCPNLRKVFFSCRIGRIAPSIKHLTRLEKLSCIGTFLDCIPTEIKHLKALKDLYIRENRLLDKLPPEINVLDHLKQMSIESCGLTSVPARFTLPRLETLCLMDNKLESLPLSTWSLPSLKELYAALNKLKSLPAEISKFLELETLELQINPLTSIPSEVASLPKLEKLGLFETGVPEQKIDGLREGVAYWDEDTPGEEEGLSDEDEDGDEGHVEKGEEEEESRD